MEEKDSKNSMDQRNVFQGLERFDLMGNKSSHDLIVHCSLIQHLVSIVKE